MPSEVVFTPVQLCTYNDDVSKQWFVYFDITDRSTGVTVRKQFRGAINYHKNLQERLRAAYETKKFWESRLKHGWSPFLHSRVSSLSKMRFNEALDWGLSKCIVSDKTKSGYTGIVAFFKNASQILKLDRAAVTAIKKQHIMLILDQIKKDRSWSNKAYNKGANYISGVFSRLVEYEVIDHNPAHSIKQLAVAETNKYETFTDAEKIVIRNYLGKVHPSFFTYLMLIYHTGIRPVECLELKVSDVYLEKRLIIIKPVFEAKNSKTKAIRMVPLNKHLVELLEQHLKGWEGSDSFIFGSPNGPGGNRGSQLGNISGAMRSDYFYPSEFHVKRDTATKLWKRLIIDGLGINKYMYALKHTGGDDKILAGISIDALKEMYGHTSKYMTERYAKKIKGVYREQIITNSPDF